MPKGLPIEPEFRAEHSSKVKNFISNKQIECVIHFASLKSVEESEKIPNEYWRNNLDSTFNVLKAMEDEGLKALVFSSSASVYGQSKIQPLTEDTNLIPESTYGKTTQKSIQ